MLSNLCVTITLLLAAADAKTEANLRAIIASQTEQIRALQTKGENAEESRQATQKAVSVAATAVKVATARHEEESAELRRGTGFSARAAEMAEEAARLGEANSKALKISAAEVQMHTASITELKRFAVLTGRLLTAVAGAILIQVVLLFTLVVRRKR